MIDPLSKRLYLDYNATAPLRPQAKQVMMQVLEYTGNPSSIHFFGRKMHGIMEQARSRVTSIFGLKDNQCIFTASCTEANNMVLRGNVAPQIMVSATEHDSVRLALPNPKILPVSQDGVVDLNHLENFLKKNESPVLVSVMIANSETGVIQPIDDIVNICKKFGAFVHTDATQAIGRIPVNIQKIDFTTFSSHKLGGPFGCGVVLLGSSTNINPMLFGGGQERGRRAGTENIPAIAGFAAALELAVSEQTQQSNQLQIWRMILEQQMQETRPDLVVHGKNTPRLPNTICYSIPGIPQIQQLMNFDLEGVAVSSGSACSSGKVRHSHVLQAMGLSADLTSSAIRLSMGWNTQKPDIDHFMKVWHKLYKRPVISNNV